MSKSIKIWHVAFYILSVIPWTFSASLIAAFIHASNELGHTPRYNQPDPKDLSTYAIFNDTIEFTFTAFALATLIVLIALPAYAVTYRKHFCWLPPFLCFVSYTFAVGMFMSDIMEWWLD